MKNKSWRFKFAVFVASLGLTIIIVFLFFKAFNDWSFIINSKLASEYGAFVGGIAGSLFTLAAFLLLYETLIAQKIAFQIQQFESNFFELLKIHRENVNEIKYESYSGRIFFIYIRDDFGRIYKIIKEIDKSEQLNEKERVNLGYQILYFGIQRYQAILGKRLISFKNNQLPIVKQIISKADKLKNTTAIKIFNGHQVRLGHYYRHLYQMVLYVDQTDFLTDNKKYFYLKTLRSQLSSHEQVLFFFNSLSDLGSGWTANNFDLITKYRLIKNIPPGLTFGIDPRKYYSKIEFDEYFHDIEEIIDEDDEEIIGEDDFSSLS